MTQETAVSLMFLGRNYVIIYVIQEIAFIIRYVHQINKISFSEILFVTILTERRRIMRTTVTRKFTQHIQTGAFALLLIATPALAEAPMQLPTPAQQANVQRLILTNGCLGCDLTGADLTEAHLIGADLRDANLQWANLTDVNLEGADLEGADLTGANLTGAYLTNAYLANTQLVGVNFTNAHLYNVDLTGATMEDINLAGADVFNTPISVGGEEIPECEWQMLKPVIPLK